jgi:hypothetical protein
VTKFSYCLLQYCGISFARLTAKAAIDIIERKSLSVSNQSSPQQHEMHLIETHSSGATEWYCPTCGRRFLMQWPPNYKKIIIEAGDEHAVHSGGIGGLKMNVSTITQEEDSQEERYLAPWDEWLNNTDFENWWGQDSP